jgi:hypothetical protein
VIVAAAANGAGEREEGDVNAKLLCGWLGTPHGGRGDSAHLFPQSSRASFSSAPSRGRTAGAAGFTRDEPGENMGFISLDKPDWGGG